MTSTTPAASCSSCGFWRIGPAPNPPLSQTGPVAPRDPLKAQGHCHALPPDRFGHPETSGRDSCGLHLQASPGVALASAWDALASALARALPTATTATLAQPGEGLDDDDGAPLATDPATDTDTDASKGASKVPADPGALARELRGRGLSLRAVAAELALHGVARADGRPLGAEQVSRLL